MLHFEAESFSKLCRLIQMMIDMARPGQNFPIAGIIDESRGSIPLIRGFCKTIGLEVSADYVDRVESLLNSEGTTAEMLNAKYQALAEVIEAECKRHLFLYVPKPNAGYFQAKEAADFAITIRFPPVIEDLAEAGNCYALDRGTACVFHLMRVIEVGINAIQQALNIESTSVSPSWWAMVEDIRAEVERQKANKPSAWKLFYDQVTTNLHSIRLAWRNETMHPKKTYTPEEALEILNATKTFMRHLAASLDEHGS